VKELLYAFLWKPFLVMAHLKRLLINLNLEMKIRDLMKKPLFVEPDESLDVVSKKMAAKGKDVVVVMKDKAVQGLVTAEDIFFAMKSYVLGKNLLEQIPPEIRDMKISELMRTPAAKEFMQSCGLMSTDMCVVIDADDIVVNAIRVMAVSGMDHILVVDKDGVAGTLSDVDLLKAFK
jgi:CBS domain-containing protein